MKRLSLLTLIALGMIASASAATNNIILNGTTYTNGGSYNAGIGKWVLSDNTGDDNSGIGYGALGYNTTGEGNTANGNDALWSNKIGSQNTANGDQALYNNTSGSYNAVNAAFSMYFNTTGQYNTANGYAALYNNTTGSYNTVNGAFSMYFNTTGHENTANGNAALYTNSTGSYNTADGEYAMANILSSSYNTAIGYNAMGYAQDGNSNIAVGSGAGDNLILGDNNIYLGNEGKTSGYESNSIWIGTQGSHTATYIAGIVGSSVTNGAVVIVNTNGQLGTSSVSAFTGQTAAPNSLLTNAAFLQALATNQVFLNAVANNASSPFITGNRAFQTITFSAIPIQSRTGKPITLHAASSVGLKPISYTVANTSIGTVSTNGILTLTGAGTTTIMAKQAGNSYYNPSTAIQTLIVK